MNKLVTEQLGLALNESLRKLTGQITYGYKDELMLVFAVAPKRNTLAVNVSESKFATSRMNRAEIGIFGTKDPTKAVRLLVKAYPKALLLLRKDPSR